MSITQIEADHLIGLAKVFDDNASLSLGPPPIEWSRELTALATKEKFLLDFRRNGLEISKYSYNKRYRQTIILLRYCSSVRHTNPDGTKFNGPHLHVFREGFDDKFAFPVSDIGVEDGDDMATVLVRLLAYCNVSEVPVIDPGLF